MNFIKAFSLIPKKAWIYLVLVIIGMLSISFSYKKGFESGVDRQNSIHMKEVRVATDRALSKANKDLQEAVSRQKEGLKAVSDLNNRLSQVEAERLKLEEDLRNAINNPPDVCNKLDTTYYELYKRLYNTPKPD